MTNFKPLTEQEDYNDGRLFKSVFITGYESTYEELEDSFKILKPKWYAYQLEECPTTKRRHLQGCFGGGQWRFKQLKKVLPPKTYIAPCKAPA